MTFEYRLVNLHNVADGSCESVKYFLKFYGVAKFDDNDVIALQSLIKEISLENRFDFNVSYVIPRLDKEFDLVKVGSGIIVNIEMKLTKLDVEQCVENYRLLKNNYPDYFVFCFNYIKEDNTILLLDIEKESLKESSFAFLNNVLSKIVDAIKLDVNINISPVYDFESFSYNDYFLSKWQSSAFDGVVGSEKKINIITGRPGSGKSMLALYLCDYYRKTSDYLINYLVPFKYKEIINQRLIKTFNIESVRSVFSKGDDFNCDICIVDEAQRITMGEYIFLKSRVKNKIIFIGDINQNIDGEHEFKDIYESRSNNIAYFSMINVIRTDDTFDCFARKILDIPKKGIKNKKIDKSKIEILMFNELKTYNLKDFIYIEPSKSKYSSNCRYNCSHKRCSNFIRVCLSEKNTHDVVSCEFDNVLLYLCDGFVIRNGNLSQYKDVCYRNIKSHLYSIITRTVNKLIVVTDRIEVYNYLMRCLYEM